MSLRGPVEVLQSGFHCIYFRYRWKYSKNDKWGVAVTDISWEWLKNKASRLLHKITRALNLTDFLKNFILLTFTV